ncbi:helix-turn-helix transcriptional regulator [Flavobacterium sp. H122]|uniref:helix-turn-helix transcriptional regulator n=1 Tax=Flavobacterium sp. H122 TaxID=2529860 RepID=UPI0010AA88AE|nr:helix-turn-helix transcriptional regulator [Flavobacterium sp. H122]
MEFSKIIIFFFSALGAFNGIVLSLYFLLLKKTRNISDLFLGGLLAALSIRIGKSVFFYFNSHLSKTYLQIGLSACFLIGPLLFFYIKSKTHSFNINTAKYTLLGLFLFIVALGLLFPYEIYVELWKKPIYWTINILWLLFIVLSFYVSRKTWAKLIYNTNKISQEDMWILSVLTGVFVIWTAYFTARYTSYISGALSFSFCFYISILLFYTKRNDAVNFPVKKEKYANKLEQDTVNEISQQFLLAFETNKLYKNPNLTLPLLAQNLNVRPQVLSQYINDNLNRSFTQLINEYRIEEAKRLLKEETNFKIDAIGLECGFNSTSAFYSSFKKITGITPSNYSKS